MNDLAFWPRFLGEGQSPSPLQPADASPAARLQMTLATSSGGSRSCSVTLAATWMARTKILHACHLLLRKRVYAENWYIVLYAAVLPYVVNVCVVSLLCCSKWSMFTHQGVGVLRSLLLHPSSTPVDGPGSQPTDTLVHTLCVSLALVPTAQNHAQMNVHILCLGHLVTSEFWQKTVRILNCNQTLVGKWL